MLLKLCNVPFEVKHLEEMRNGKIWFILSLIRKALSRASGVDVGPAR